MVATAFGNVINLQAAGPGVSAPSYRLLMECRDLAARRLREALREMLQGSCEAFAERAEASRDTNDRRFFLHLADAIKAQGARLEAQLAARWTQGFDTVLKGAEVRGAAAPMREEMQIVDYGEMDEELALKSLVRWLHDRCDDELYALGRRFSQLLGRKGAEEGDNPAAPDVLVRAMQAALRDGGFNTPERLELCRSLDAVVADHVAPIYHAVNAHLLKHHVLPNLRRDYARSAGPSAERKVNKTPADGDMFAMLQQLVAGSAKLPGAPAPAGTVPGSAAAAMLAGGGPSLPPAQVWASLDTLQQAPPGTLAGAPNGAEGGNVLHHFRASEVGQSLGQLDAITVDIVAMLFDMIFDDREIADPIKALVGKLQIPVLKVAMLDRGFFSSKAHPARRLLDVISRAALRWGRQVGHDDPIYRKLADIIDRIHSDFRQDTALFGALCDDLERFLKVQESAADGNVTRAALLVARREREEVAELAAAGELQAWLDSSLPAVIADLLDHEWRTLLRCTHLDDGPDSEAWRGALATAEELVESARPKHGGQDRQALAQQLPVLLRQLSAGFDRIGVGADRRHALLDGLFSMHASALRGAELPPAPDTVAVNTSVVDIGEPAVTSQALGDGEVTVESISLASLAPFADASPDVEALQRGDWVEFMQPDATPVRYRLSWISPQRGIYLFTNPQSPHALAVSPEAMSLQLQRGEVRIISTEPIFDRALTRAIETLQAA